ncbi:3-oxoacyl-(Acyl-carrier-protein) reductase [Nitrospira japonica]|uniref:3-oxoacyl-(Acyl-carrier-protein) reductase n=1 Tax=Nitrospira japonica TaxID=1325564 RepID=A0A1W1I974_9BACT|nr:SDR family NAD(P)-dependent oxidoreductase [Nitrospira japonica]SLM49577.1 3-oxoacyl-(Acyl-carrier-protein) reductase [Nitrospira japonica]
MRHAQIVSETDRGGIARGKRPAVLVTGASGIIGRAISLAFAATGWHIGIHYHRNTQAAGATLEQVRADGGEGALYQADLRDSRSMRQMAEAFAKDAPQEWACVCNAGIGASDMLIRQRVDRWSDIIETNLTGTFHCMQAVGRILCAGNGGSIVVIGSHAGFHGTTGQAAYAASKAGLLGLMKTAALEWGPRNVRVNLLLPGWQKTPLSQSAMSDDDTRIDHALHRTPSIESVARMVVHLIQAEDVSGQIWNCDSRHL